MTNSNARRSLETARNMAALVSKTNAIKAIASKADTCGKLAENRVRTGSLQSLENGFRLFEKMTELSTQLTAL